MQARLKTINLFCKSPQLLRAFYIAVFGLHELEFLAEPPDLFILEGGSCQICLRRNVKKNQLLIAPSVELWFEVENPLQTLNNVKAFGGTILLEEPSHELGIAFYATDPEGHPLLIQNCFESITSNYY